MRTIKIALLIGSIALLLAAANVSAEEAKPQPTPADKIIVPVTVDSNELRTYKVSVQIKGRVAGEDSKKPIDIDILATMNIDHKYGHREKDGLLPLEISVASAEATVGGEKFMTPASDFPKLTLLLDKSWKITSVFGLAGTRYADQVSGLNYGNLISLFFVPDIDKDHAIGEKWSSKAKLPGSEQEIEITSSILSVGEMDGLKTIVVHEDWGWYIQKLKNGNTTYSQIKVDSTFTLDTGKLLKSHADCLILYQDPTVRKPEDQELKSNSKIDISLEKPSARQTSGS